VTYTLNFRDRLELELSTCDSAHLSERIVYSAPTAALKIARSVSLKTPALSPMQSGGYIDVVDLFSGCGGMSYGFRAIGDIVKSYRIVAAADIDEHANSTYFRNIGVRPMCVDLRHVAQSPDSIKQFGAKLPRSKGAPLVLVGCAPCQGFSSHRKKHWHRPVDDRNSLIASFARIAATLQPNVVIMENVPDLLSYKYWHFYEFLKSILEESGYTVRARIINSAGFGVPQERFRAIVIAMKRSFEMVKPYLAPSKFRTVRDAIGSLPVVKPGVMDARDPMHQTTNHRHSTIATIKRVPKNGGNRPAGAGPKCLDRIRGFYDVYGRLFWDKPAITITGYSRNPASGRYVHPDQDRGLSIREAALLQGFPKKFVFDGPFDDKFMQIGNAVPPAFSAYLAGYLLSEMVGKHNQKQLSFEEDINQPLSNSFSSVIAGMKSKRD
jgi:DNA (cytosine-5)-methyltransferase 1